MNIEPYDVSAASTPATMPSSAAWSLAASTLTASLKT